MEKIVSEHTSRTRKEQSSAPRIEVITDANQIRKRFLKLVSNATSEIQIVFPTQAAFRREEIIGVNKELEIASSSRNINVRLLTPLDNKVRETISAHHWVLNSENSGQEQPSSGGPIIREIDSPSNAVQITFVILDRSRSFIIEVKDNSKLEFEEAIGLATYSDSKPTVLSYVAFFEKLWHESDLRKSESAARRQLMESLRREEKTSQQAKLLQDIMAHDIVNYNQIIKLQTEMLEDQQVRDGKEYYDALRSIRSAVDSSTNLLEGARKLGRVLSNQGRRLTPRDLRASIENSISLIIKANPGRTVRHKATFYPPDADVAFLTAADELLDDIFANLYSNSVKYSDGDVVEIETVVDKRVNYWKISITDKGRGIPDERKISLFNRYSTNSRGSGLGLSIVHALVTRYSGKIHVHDRIEGDCTQGTAFHLHLPIASPVS